MFGGGGFGGGTGWIGHGAKAAQTAARLLAIALAAFFVDALSLDRSPWEAIRQKIIKKCPGACWCACQYRVKVLDEKGEIVGAKNVWKPWGLAPSSSTCLKLCNLAVGRLPLGAGYSAVSELLSYTCPRI